MNTHVRARLLTSGRDCACVAERIRGGGRDDGPAQIVIDMQRVRNTQKFESVTELLDTKLSRGLTRFLYALLVTSEIRIMSERESLNVCSSLYEILKPTFFPISSISKDESLRGSILISFPFSSRKLALNWNIFQKVPKVAVVLLLLDGLLQKY